MSSDKNKALFVESQKVIPGGVNSPVIAFTNMDRGLFSLKKPNGLIFTMLTEISILILFQAGGL